MATDLTAAKCPIAVVLGSLGSTESKLIIVEGIFVIGGAMACNFLPSILVLPGIACDSLLVQSR